MARFINAPVQKNLPCATFPHANSRKLVVSWLVLCGVGIPRTPFHRNLSLPSLLLFSSIRASPKRVRTVCRALLHNTAGRQGFTRRSHDSDTTIPFTRIVHGDALFYCLLRFILIGHGDKVTTNIVFLPPSTHIVMILMISMILMNPTSGLKSPFRACHCFPEY